MRQPKFKIGQRVKDVFMNQIFTLGFVEWDNEENDYYYSSLGWYWIPENDLVLMEE